MSAERFMELVKECKGFEFSQAYRDEVDYLMGGQGQTYWFTVLKDGSVKESYVGKLENGVWTDVHIKGRGKSKKITEKPAGSTIRRIAAQAYLIQDEEWVQKKKPRLIEDSHPHYHYTLGFGDKALKVSAAYGVTIGYSDLKDAAAGFHLRSLETGSGVKAP